MSDSTALSYVMQPHCMCAGPYCGQDRDVPRHKSGDSKLIKGERDRWTFFQQSVSIASEIEGDAAMFSKLIVALYLMFGAPVLVAFGYGAYLATQPSGTSGGSVVTVTNGAPPVSIGTSSGGLTTTHGVPGPIAGAGFPVLAVGYGAYWLVRRRRRAQ